MFTSQQLEKYRTTLQTMQNDHEERASSLREEAFHGVGGDNVGDLSHAPTHLADMGNQESDAVVSVGLAANDASIRREIESALDRLQNGTFGLCEQCQKEIDRNRRGAIPYARMCISCAKLSHS